MYVAHSMEEDLHNPGAYQASSPTSSLAAGDVHASRSRFALEYRYLASTIQSQKSGRDMGDPEGIVGLVLVTGPRDERSLIPHKQADEKDREAMALRPRHPRNALLGTGKRLHAGWGVEYEMRFACRSEGWKSFALLKYRRMEVKDGP